MASLETRNVSRDSLFLFAELTLDGQPQPVRVKVRNLSSGGLMAEASCTVARGDRLALTLRNIGMVKGQVAWVQGNRFGVAFDSEIDPKRAREQPSAGEVEAPRYARPQVDAKKFDDGEFDVRRV